ncbi:MAG: S9 family peptidase, partial [Phototrophicaceae bacterium]
MQLPTTIDTLIELPTPANPQLSPDGQWVAFTVSQPNWKDNAFINQIHLVASDGNSPARQLTFGTISNGNPRWSPDSQYLIFLSKRNDDKANQIYRLVIAGGEAERLTELETGISNLAYSPDGTRIAFVATSPKTPQEKKREEKFGDYVEDNVDYQRSHLWMLTLDTKKVTQLTYGDTLHVRDFSWHPDSQRIAVNAMPAPDMGVLLETRNYLLDVNTYEIRPLTPKRTFSPCWSPDGTQLVYQQGVYESSEGAFYKNGKLAILTLDSNEIRELNLDFDEDIYPSKWANEGIYFWAFQRTSIRPFRLEADEQTITTLLPDDLDNFVSTQYSFNDAATKCAIVFTTAERYQDVAVLDTSSSELTILTDFDEPTRGWDLPRHELYRWHSADGTEIEGILTKPLDFDPEKHYPLLVITHGGPTWTSFQSKLGGYERRIYPIYQWVQQGAIILQPNYRGSAGYGEAFRGLNVNNLGVGDYADVISGVDALIDEGFIDENNVGAMGWSQGGYISAFITTYSDRFKAVSVGAGISNWMTYYVNTDVHPFTINYLSATPWDDPDIYAKTSPMTYIKNAQTPTLIQHGENDKRVPVPNAFELHQGLLDQGVRSKLVVYPNMPHGPQTPKQVRHIMIDNFEWFNHYIFGIDADEDVKPLYIVLASADETSSLVADVLNLAKRDDADYRVITGAGDLSDNQADAVAKPSMDDIEDVIAKLREQLTDLASQEIILFTDKIEK